MRRRLPGALVAILCCVCLVRSAAHAQELEPRLLTNVPVGSNFVVAAYGLASGNILLDPAVPIEGLNSDLHTFLGA